MSAFGSVALLSDVNYPNITDVVALICCWLTTLTIRCREINVMNAMICRIDRYAGQFVISSKININFLKKIDLKSIINVFKNYKN